MEDRKTKDDAGTLDVREVVEEILGLRVIKTRPGADKDEINLECPFCGDGKPDHFYVEATVGLWNCFKCEEHGNLRSLCDALLKEGQIDEETHGRAVALLRAGRGRSASVERREPVKDGEPVRQLLRRVAELCHAALLKKDRRELLARVAPATIDERLLGVSSPEIVAELISSFGEPLCEEVGVVVTLGGRLAPRWQGAFTIPYVRGGEVLNIDYRLRDPADIKEWGRYQALPGRPRPLYNADALVAGGTVFVAEGAFDAMSLAEHGFPAVGIPGKRTFKDEWAEDFKRAGVATAFVVLDNGETGTEEARSRIRERLERDSSVEVIDVFLPAEVKDANEYFAKHAGTSDGFAAMVTAARAAHEKERHPGSLASFWPTFETTLRSRAGRKLLGMESGFAKLDMLTGGIRGLAVLGGLPGLGKTTLALQLAWQIAERNKAPVLYYSFEMYRQELTEKIVSRLAGVSYDKVALAVILGRDHSAKLEGVKKEIERVGGLVCVIDKDRRTRLEQIRSDVLAVKRLHRSEQAFVVIDSLQAFCTYAGAGDSFRSSKERIDEVVARLGETARETGSGLLVISHIPKAKMGREDQFIFSGSAGIDYEADVTMGLFPPSAVSVSDDTGRPAPHPSRTPLGEPVRLALLKNRFGSLGQVDLRFRGVISKFEEAS